MVLLVLFLFLYYLQFIALLLVCNFLLFFDRIILLKNTISEVCMSGMEVRKTKLEPNIAASNFLGVALTITATYLFSTGPASVVAYAATLAALVCFEHSGAMVRSVLKYEEPRIARSNVLGVALTITATYLFSTGPASVVAYAVTLAALVCFEHSWSMVRALALLSRKWPEVSSGASETA